MVSIGTIKTTGSVSNPSTVLARWLYLVPKEILESTKPDLVAFPLIGKHFGFLRPSIQATSYSFSWSHNFPIKEPALERKLALATTCGFPAPPSRKKGIYPMIPTIDIVELNLAKDAVISDTE